MSKESVETGKTKKRRKVRCQSPAQKGIFGLFARFDKRIGRGRGLGRRTNGLNSFEHDLLWRSWKGGGGAMLLASFKGDQLLLLFAYK